MESLQRLTEEGGRGEERIAPPRIVYFSLLDNEDLGGGEGGRINLVLSPVREGIVGGDQIGIIS